MEVNITLVVLCMYLTSYIHININTFCLYTANRVDHDQVALFVQRAIGPVCWLWPMHNMSRQLNESQLYSISLAMKNKLQLIQGPPGLLLCHCKLRFLLHVLNI